MPIPPDTTTGQVLNDALASFEITSDGTTRYYLLYDGTEIATTTTIGSLVDGEHGHQHQITFALRTETVSGAR